ncbi:glycosyltransferase family 2 protein [Raineya orbicola]|jgi:putative glycosyltransferase|uniref:Glycosyl transferase family 2 n=1 Tax=Raineya orbicola TaxID=2016530 RepID=A0A2N3IA65_9BACT|nr:glycosyltransferase family 2 protein [Raineya orbicola]PKQ67222.1 Glycosyl transferase family 2 [Raineya orbicola]
MKISVLTTLYYSENYIQEFYNRTLACLQKIQCSYEFVFVDDGSPDRSLEKAIAIAQKDSNVKVIELSRNFGHHPALLTALQNATGDWIFLIDSDLEEAPELLLTYWQNLEQNSDFDVIYGVQEKRKGNWFEKVSGKVYYKLFGLISNINYPADTLTARLMSRKYVQALLQFPEREMDLWCIFQMAGFRQKAIIVNKGFKGKSTYTLKRKLQIALNTITSVSHRPLYFVFYLGLLITLFALGYITWIIYQYFAYDEKIEGWTSLAVSIWAIGGLVVFSIGIVGIYLAKIFLEIKQRPRSIIRNVYEKDSIKIKDDSLES